MSQFDQLRSWERYFRSLKQCGLQQAIIESELTYGGDDSYTVEQGSREAPLAWLLHDVPFNCFLPVVPICLHLVTSNSEVFLLFSFVSMIRWVTFMITSFSKALRIFSASRVQFAFQRTLKCSVIELVSVLFIPPHQDGKLFVHTSEGSFQILAAG